MKTLVFNKESWHYKLARGYGHSCTDICTYGRQVLKGILEAVFLFFFGSAAIAACVGVVGMLLFLVASFLSYVAAGLVAGVWPDPNDAIIMGGTTVIVIMGGATVLVVGRLMKMCDKSKPFIPKDSFIAEAYKSWKDKYCVPVEFK